MTCTVIDGRKIAADLHDEVAREVQHLADQSIPCGLATVAVGENYAATIYERRLQRIARQLDVSYRGVSLPATSTQDQVLRAIDTLNGDPNVHVLLVLRPLPGHIHEREIFQRLAPIKDIEALHPENSGLLALGVPRYVPSTVAATYHVLDHWLDVAGEVRSRFYRQSLVVVVGRSNNVGKPAVSLAYHRQAAVESIDEWASANGKLGWHTRRADVLIVAAGVPGLIRAEHVREGAVVLDVGINPIRDPRTGGIRMVGDVDFDDVAPRARAITPVPGGIGPVTDVWLLRNTVAAARDAAGCRTAPTQKVRVNDVITP